MSRRLLLSLGLLLWPETAAAHSPIEGVGTFYAGLLHPLAVPAHLLALLALGCWLAQQSLPARRTGVLVFAAGLLLLPFGDLLPAAVAGLLPLLFALLAGALAAARVAAGPWLALLVALLAALALAADSGFEDGGRGEAIRFFAGVWLGACLLSVNLAAHASRLAGRWNGLVLRVAGAWMAAAAAMVAALALAPAT